MPPEDRRKLETLAAAADFFQIDRMKAVIMDTEQKLITKEAMDHPRFKEVMELHFDPEGERWVDISGKGIPSLQKLLKDGWNIER